MIQLANRYPAFFVTVVALFFPIFNSSYQLLAADNDHFESRIRPVLVEKCLRCHGPDRQSGGVRLDSTEGWAKGGKKGPILDAKNPGQSRVLWAVRQEADIKAMPPDEPLTPRELADLTRWVEGGAKWPAAVSRVAVKTHWSFVPPASSIPLPAGAAAHPVDRFVEAKLAQQGLQPLPQAPREVLLRRLSFHLTGLPPTLEEQSRFGSLPADSWFSQAMEHYLNSPGYGVRWGRMWLDVVRYADTAGETADFPVPQAYRYRNWVIDAFRADLPFDAFLRQQIAGDLMARVENAQGDHAESLMVATGYWAIARRFGFDVLDDHYLTLEDALDTFGKSTLGLGLSCARCHDHKYDPIPTADYYALYGILESTRFPMPGCEKTKVPADFPRPVDEATQAAITYLEKRLDSARKVAGEPGRALRKLIGEAKPLASVVLTANGAGAFPPDLTTQAKAGDLVLLEILPNGNFGGDSTLVRWTIETTQGGRRTRNDATAAMLALSQSDAPYAWGDWLPLDTSGESVPVLGTFVANALNTQHLMVWRGAEDWPSAFVNTKDQPLSFQTVKPPARSLALHPGPRGPVGLAFRVKESGPLKLEGSFQKIDAGGDGVTAQVRVIPGGSALLDTLMGQSAQADFLAAALNSLREKSPLLYAVTEGGVHDAQLHKRGNPKDRGDPVKRRNLTLLGGQPLTNPEQSGRLELAGWLTDPNNPLTARVFVNRIWQGHFGQGLVRTPNDFGLRGDPPTHPELLDWLAREFQKNGWSIKQLHRILLTSQTWKRSSLADSRLIEADPENRWLARFPRLRSSAEELRDSLLAVSGELDSTDGQAHPFPPQNQWGFTQHGPFRAIYDSNKRSVFLMVQRIQRHPFLSLFDGADPNSSTGTRQVTTVPPQALWFMNNPFVQARAQKLVESLPGEPTEARVDRLCRLLFARPAQTQDVDEAREFLASQGSGDSQKAWTMLVRTLLASNEFTHRD